MSPRMTVMAASPLISIITPSFQQGSFIAETITSVLSQDYPSFELLVMDGGSTDNTLQVLQTFQNDSRLSWISEPDQGQVDAINKGLQRAKGEIIAWLNSDDIYLHPQVLAEAVQAFHEHPSAGLVSGTGIIINASSEPVRPIQSYPQRLTFDQIKYRNFVLQPATFARRKVFDKVSLNQAYSYVFDWDFWIQCSQSFAIVPVDIRWAGYRFWGSNKTAQGSYRRTHEQAQLAQEYLGKNSWQYYTLRTASVFYRFIEALPANLQPIPRRSLRAVALGLSKISRYRIAVF